MSALLHDLTRRPALTESQVLAALGTLAGLIDQHREACVEGGFEGDQVVSSLESAAVLVRYAAEAFR